MIGWLIQNLLYLRSAVKATDTPHQLALGLAMGMLLGLVPKGNLIAVFFSILILAFRLNLSVGMLSALAFSFAGSLLDPVTHRLGLFVLGMQVLKPAWDAIYDFPLAPWTSFNNSVVMGNLLVGACMFYPSYRTGLYYFCQQAERRRRKLAGDESQATISDAPNSDAAQSSDAAPSSAPAEGDRDAADFDRESWEQWLTGISPGEWPELLTHAATLAYWTTTSGSAADRWSMSCALSDALQQPPPTPLEQAVEAERLAAMSSAEASTESSSALASESSSESSTEAASASAGEASLQLATDSDSSLPADVEADDAGSDSALDALAASPLAETDEPPQSNLSEAAEASLPDGDVDARDLPAIRSTTNPLAALERAPRRQLVTALQQLAERTRFPEVQPVSVSVLLDDVEPAVESPLVATDHSADGSVPPSEELPAESSTIPAEAQSQSPMPAAPTISLRAFQVVVASCGAWDETLAMDAPEPPAVAADSQAEFTAPLSAPSPEFWAPANKAA